MVHEDVKPTLVQYDGIVEGWKDHSRVAKFIGPYSSRRLFSDWKAACPNEKTQKQAGWPAFIKFMSAYYRPTENLMLKNFQFCSLSQDKAEPFVAFCNRVGKEAKHCQLRCPAADCSAEFTAIRDQVIIGCLNDEIREEALKKSWLFDELRQEGMRIESASKGASAISGDALNKLGKYSIKNAKKNAQYTSKKVNCFSCGISCERRDISAHARNCPAKSCLLYTSPSPRD